MPAEGRLPQRPGAQVRVAAPPETALSAPRKAASSPARGFAHFPEVAMFPGQALALLLLLPQDRPEVVKPAPRSEPEQRELDARKLFAAGVLQAKRGLFLDAVKSFEAVLKLDPDAVPPRRMLAAHYLTIGRPDDALAMARQVTEKAADDYIGWRIYADQLKDLGRAKEAIAALSKGAELESAVKAPDQRVVMLNRLATWARDTGDHAASAAALRRLLTVLEQNRERFRTSEFLDNEAFADEMAAAHERLGEALLKLDRL